MIFMRFTTRSASGFLPSTLLQYSATSCIFSFSLVVLFNIWLATHEEMGVHESSLARTPHGRGKDKEESAPTWSRLTRSVSMPTYCSMEISSRCTRSTCHRP